MCKGCHLPGEDHAAEAAAADGAHGQLGAAVQQALGAGVAAEMSRAAALADEDVGAQLPARQSRPLISSPGRRSGCAHRACARPLSKQFLTRDSSKAARRGAACMQAPVHSLPHQPITWNVRGDFAKPSEQELLDEGHQQSGLLGSELTGSSSALCRCQHGPAQAGAGAWTCAMLPPGLLTAPRLTASPP